MLESCPRCVVSSCFLGLRLLRPGVGVQLLQVLGVVGLRVRLRQVVEGRRKQVILLLL